VSLNLERTVKPQGT